MRQGRYLDLDACPYCGVTHPAIVARSGGKSNTDHVFETSSHDNDYSRFWGVYVCRSCGGVILAQSDSYMDISDVIPKPMSVSFEVPDRARCYLQEAIATLAAPSASLMVAASAVDSMLKAKGFKDGSLYKRIEEAANQHVITKEMADWAHQVRLEANGQRHADEDEAIPTKADAERSLEFALALAEFLFVLPARVTRGLKETTVPQ